MFTVYILYSKSKDRYYIGHTSDLEDRLIRHDGGRSKSTKNGTPWRIIYTETFKTKSEAYKRELEIKGKNPDNLLNYSSSSSVGKSIPKFFGTVPELVPIFRHSNPGAITKVNPIGLTF